PRKCTGPSGAHLLPGEFAFQDVLLAPIRTSSDRFFAIALARAGRDWLRWAPALGSFFRPPLVHLQRASGPAGWDLTSCATTGRSKARPAKSVVGTRFVHAQDRRHFRRLRFGKTPGSGWSSSQGRTVVADGSRNSRNDLGFVFHGLSPGSRQGWTARF